VEHGGDFLTAVDAYRREAVSPQKLPDLLEAFGPCEPDWKATIVSLLSIIRNHEDSLTPAEKRKVLAIDHIMLAELSPTA
jgi:hypothetical protein